MLDQLLNDVRTPILAISWPSPQAHKVTAAAPAIVLSF